ncbi:MAG: bifunctional aspartate kinase/homoserine dehydrogenase I [Bacteroidota bacterium]|jgi:aspartokinase/homoserine dehydrogenase 1|nr:bifunctional aspartate kinase/homoserine dehydrogenase I [Algoriphagus sp.]
MKIIKFGGSSVETPENISQVFRIIQEKLVQGDLAVVFSAFGGVTEELLALAKKAQLGDLSYQNNLKELEKRHFSLVDQLLPFEKRAELHAFILERFNELQDLYHGIFLIKEQSLRTLDYVASFGERLSTYILSEGLKAVGLQARYVDARELIRTDDRFGHARVEEKVSYAQIKSFFSSHKGLNVVTGFIASTAKGETTTLGRSGSDYTAALLAGALEADALEIWTDVSGVLTANPKLVYTTFSIPQLSYAEAMELSHFGAKVIFPATMRPAMKKNIPIYIKNTFDPSHPGTLINGEVRYEGLIKGVSSRDQIAMLTLQGTGLATSGRILGRIFDSLAEAQVNIFLISQSSSQHSICLAIAAEEALVAKNILEREFNRELISGEMEAISLLHDLAIVAVVGENMKHDPGASGRMFRALGQNNINVAAIAQGSSELNISAVISVADLQKAVNALHEAFFLSELKVLHLFLVGTGLIGQALLQMMAQQQEKLRRENQLDIQVHGLANSRFMAFHEDGFDLQTPYLLGPKDQAMDLEKFLSTMEEMNFSNAVFVDCTASQELAKVYPRILEARVAIVTPNKKANSGALSQYLTLRKIAKRQGVKFLYETNVAAGLPVINTLQDLMLSGDTIIRIEAVLSGSMNFIFSELEKGLPFSHVLAMAKENGYTEPDPREDLSGMDVARKVVILGREAEMSLEVEDIKVESLVPLGLQSPVSIEDFLEGISQQDSYYSQLLEKASTRGERLRFMAILEEGRAEVGLKPIPNSHPFSSLQGADNMILLTTERYHDRPMIIRGPGAGAAVTAAGVFADVIRIGNYTRE